MPGGPNPQSVSGQRAWGRNTTDAEGWCSRDCQASRAFLILMTVDDRQMLHVGPLANQQRARKRRRGRRGLRRLLLAAFLLLAVTVAGIGVAWPLTPSVADAEQRIAQHLAAHGGKDGHVLPVPDRVGEAVIAVEDSRFGWHVGVDPVGIARAALSFSRGDAGGATLDQQLAKNVWTGDGGWLQKAEQVVLSFKLEAAYSKDQILEMYLADGYFGHGYYGLSAAAHGYFGVAPNALSWGQASLLAGVLQAPSADDPYRHLARAQRRQRHVLDRLVAVGRLSPAEADAAARAPLSLR